MGKSCGPGSWRCGGKNGDYPGYIPRVVTGNGHFLPQLTACSNLDISVV